MRRKQGMKARWLAGLTVVIAGTALGGAVTAPSQAAPLSKVPPVAAGNSNVLTSHNWSGYEQTGAKYHSVSATWTVPSVSSTWAYVVPVEGLVGSRKSIFMTSLSGLVKSLPSTL